jgi:hypothetical protein
MEEIIKKLDRIETRLSSIEQDLALIKTSCSTMDNHISFVETTYSSLKVPLNYLKYITGTTTRELIDNKK